MEKAKNIVLVVCGVMLFFGSQAAYGTWLYLFAWAAGVCIVKQVLEGHVIRIQIL